MNDTPLRLPRLSSSCIPGSGSALRYSHSCHYHTRRRHIAPLSSCSKAFYSRGLIIIDCVFGLALVTCHDDHELDVCVSPRPCASCPCASCAAGCCSCGSITISDATIVRSRVVDQCCASPLDTHQDQVTLSQYIPGRIRNVFHCLGDNSTWQLTRQTTHSLTLSSTSNNTRPVSRHVFYLPCAILRIRDDVDATYYSE